MRRGKKGLMIRCFPRMELVHGLSRVKFNTAGCRAKLTCGSEASIIIFF